MIETFGQRFTKLRKEKGLTQEDIANRVNISAQAVSKWENDISMPDITVLILLADIFDISLDELLGRNNKQVVKLINEDNKKDINKMVLRMKVFTTDGDKININLPIPLLKVCIESNMEMPQLNGNNYFSNIDFKQIYSLIEQGVIGELMSVELSTGEQVVIVVE